MSLNREALQRLIDTLKQQHQDYLDGKIEALRQLISSHEKHVMEGYCPVISRSKAWCCKPVGHPGLHGSPRVRNPNQLKGLLNRSFVEWEI